MPSISPDGMSVSTSTTSVAAATELLERRHAAEELLERLEVQEEDRQVAMTVDAAVDELAELLERRTTEQCAAALAAEKAGTAKLAMAIENVMISQDEVYAEHGKQISSGTASAEWALCTEKSLRELRRMTDGLSAVAVDTLHTQVTIQQDLVAALKAGLRKSLRVNLTDLTLAQLRAHDADRALIQQELQTVRKGHAMAVAEIEIWLRAQHKRAALHQAEAHSSTLKKMFAESQQEVLAAKHSETLAMQKQVAAEGLVSSLSEHIASLQKKLSKLRNSGVVAQLRRARRQLEADKQQLLQKLEVKEEQRATAAKKSRELKSKVVRLNDMVVQQRVAVKTLTDAAAQVKTKLQAVEKRSADAQVRINVLQQELQTRDEMIAKAAEARADLDKKAADLRREIAAMKKGKAKLEEDLAAARSDVARERERKADGLRVQRALEADLEARKQQVYTMRTKMGELLQEVARLRKEAEDARAAAEEEKEQRLGRASLDAFKKKRNKANAAAKEGSDGNGGGGGSGGGGNADGGGAGEGEGEGGAAKAGGASGGGAAGDALLAGLMASTPQGKALRRLSSFKAQSSAELAEARERQEADMRREIEVQVRLKLQAEIEAPGGLKDKLRREVFTEFKLKNAKMLRLAVSEAVEGEKRKSKTELESLRRSLGEQKEAMRDTMEKIQRKRGKEVKQQNALRRGLKEKDCLLSQLTLLVRALKTEVQNLRLEQQQMQQQQQQEFQPPGVEEEYIEYHDEMGDSPSAMSYRPHTAVPRRRGGGGVAAAGRGAAATRPSTAPGRRPSHDGDGNGIGNGNGSATASVRIDGRGVGGGGYDYGHSVPQVQILRLHTPDTDMARSSASTASRPLSSSSLRSGGSSSVYTNTSMPSLDGTRAASPPATRPGTASSVSWAQHPVEEQSMHQQRPSTSSGRLRKSQSLSLSSPTSAAASPVPVANWGSTSTSSSTTSSSTAASRRRKPGQQRRRRPHTSYGRTTHNNSRPRKHRGGANSKAAPGAGVRFAKATGMARGLSITTQTRAHRRRLNAQQRQRMQMRAMAKDRSVLLRSKYAQSLEANANANANHDTSTKVKAQAVVAPVLGAAAARSQRPGSAPAGGPVPVPATPVPAAGEAETPQEDEQQQQMQKSAKKKGKGRGLLPPASRTAPASARVPQV